MTLGTCYEKDLRLYVARRVELDPIHVDVVGNESECERSLTVCLRRRIGEEEKVGITRIQPSQKPFLWR